MARNCGNFRSIEQSNLRIVMPAYRSAFSEALESRLLLAASLVQDLNTSFPAGSIATLGHVGNVAIFVENDGVHGIEPYRSDGTKAGTFLLRDIAAGPEDSKLMFVATIGNTLFFGASSGTTSTLWKTNGTVAGTGKVANVSPTVSHAVIGSELFFIGTERLSDGSVRTALWKTDGSSAGTVRLSGEIGKNNTLIGDTPRMGAFGGKVFFAANDDAHGTELWQSD